MTGDSWLDAKIAQCVEKEREASMKLDEPARAGMQIECADWSDGRAYIDDLHYFEVREEAWYLTINGFQVMKKWLMDRRGTILSQDDIDEYHNIIEMINEFIQKMGRMGMQRYIDDRRYTNDSTAIR